MLTRLLDEIANHPPKEIAALIKLLGLTAQDDAYRDLVNSTFSAMPDFESRRPLLLARYFSTQDFLLLVHACSDGEGTATVALMPFLRRLVEWGLVLDQSIFGPTAFVSYRWNTPRVGLYATLGIVDNILLGPSYVARRYRASVPAIFVRKGDDEYTGTGFFTSMGSVGAKSVIVTAKHNVDPADNISFMRLGDAGGCQFNPVTGSWILHPKLDLALLEVYCDDATPAPIYPLGNPAVLARTITLGYPGIATTDSAYLLAHGGELNAVVNTYYGEERLIISNVVGPGNSGGPVLDEAGLCLGMVVNSFETQHEGGTEKANSAIPAREILNFIAPHCR